MLDTIRLKLSSLSIRNMVINWKIKYIKYDACGLSLVKATFGVLSFILLWNYVQDIENIIIIFS